MTLGGHAAPDSTCGLSSSRRHPRLKSAKCQQVLHDSTSPELEARHKTVVTWMWSRNSMPKLYQIDSNCTFGDYSDSHFNLNRPKEIAHRIATVEET